MAEEGAELAGELRRSADPADPQSGGGERLGDAVDENRVRRDLGPEDLRHHVGEAAERQHPVYLIVQQV
jgi:hypothetical protein